MGNHLEDLKAEIGFKEEAKGQSRSHLQIVANREREAQTQNFVSERNALILAGDTVFPPAGALPTDPPNPPPIVRPAFRRR